MTKYRKSIEYEDYWLRYAHPNKCYFNGQSVYYRALITRALYHWLPIEVKLIWMGISQRIVHKFNWFSLFCLYIWHSSGKSSSNLKFLKTNVHDVIHDITSAGDLNHFFWSMERRRQNVAWNVPFFAQLNSFFEKIVWYINIGTYSNL